ncbi:MAG: hypothetical protein K0R14_2157 [Burkholderiales bacterium]|jgi:OOP family OmpA-OmpF porin|nr:hypothetical protein [Burkholderiales bacterium]
MKKLLICTYTLALVQSTISHAQTLPEDINPVYLNLNTGVSTGYSFTNNATGPSNQQSGSATNNYSLGANVGYNFNQYFAIEGGYNHLWLGGSPTNQTGQIGVEDAAVKGNIPLGCVFSLYGRAGVGGFQNVGGTSGNNLANNIGVLYGAGAQWNLNNNWALRAEDWSVTGLGQNIIQFGAQLSF